MSQKSSIPAAKAPAERVVRDIRRATRKHHSAEDKIRIVLESLCAEVRQLKEALAEPREPPAQKSVIADGEDIA